MGETVNLARARKLRERAKKRAQATENAALHGESRAARKAREAREARARALLDGARRERDESGGEGP